MRKGRAGGMAYKMKEGGGRGGSLEEGVGITKGQTVGLCCKDSDKQRPLA